MKWNRQRDYHGSRSYQPDEPAAARLGRFAAWARNIARNVAKFGIQRPSAEVPVDHGKRRFSDLGGGSSRRAFTRVEDCPFPTRPNDARHPYDSRVFP